MAVFSCYYKNENNEFIPAKYDNILTFINTFQKELPVHNEYSN